jgi:hypothetical protein
MQEQEAVQFEPGVIEVLNRSGQVLQRVHFAGGTLRVGRAYDNDVIIGDPFVCPHHLLIRSEGTQMTVEDLGSVNGTFRPGGRKRVDRGGIIPGELIQIGHSQLRFQPTGSLVAPAWRDSARHGVLRFAGRPWMMPVAGILCILALALDQLVDSSRELSPAVLASQMVYPLLGIMLWSGFWSMLNQLIAHRANFRIHLSIAALAVTALFASSEGIPLLGFAFGWSSAISWLTVVGQIAILGLAMISHLQFATHGRTWVQAVGSGLLATMLIAIPQYGRLSQATEFSSLPRLEPLLKPPATKLVDGVTAEQFMARSEHLRHALERQSAD